MNPTTYIRIEGDVPKLLPDSVFDHDSLEKYLWWNPYRVVYRVIHGYGGSITCVRNFVRYPKSLQRVVEYHEVELPPAIRTAILINPYMFGVTP